MRVLCFSAGSLLVLIAVALPSVPRASVAILVVALVVVPFVLGRRSIAHALAALGAAIPLALAYVMPPSPLTALLALPWLALCLFLSAPAVLDGMRSLSGILHTSGLPQLLRDAAPVLLAVGAMFAVLDRGGASVLGLTSSIVLITAVHFHVLGFGLTTLLAALAPRRSAARAATYPLLLGITITALGFTIASAAVQWVGAVLVAGAGLLAVVAILRGSTEESAWRRPAFAVSGLVLVIGIPMGLAWATANLLGLPFVDFSTMVAVHGALNTFGVAIGVLALREFAS